MRENLKGGIEKVERGLEDGKVYQDRRERVLRFALFWVLVGLTVAIFLSI